MSVDEPANDGKMLAKDNISTNKEKEPAKVYTFFVVFFCKHQRKEDISSFDSHFYSHLSSLNFYACHAREKILVRNSHSLAAIMLR